MTHPEMRSVDIAAMLVGTLRVRRLHFNATTVIDAGKIVNLGTNPLTTYEAATDQPRAR